MADMKKEQERDELHRAIWAIADELRGAVDGWDFKNYVLGTMFYRYISKTSAITSTAARSRRATPTLTTPNCLMRKPRRPGGPGAGEGFLHPAQRALLQCAGQGSGGRKPERDAGDRLPPY